MGGQSLVRDGFAASLAVPFCLPNSATRTYRVRSGTRWRDVIKTLDPLGFSVAVMQSNHDFSTGGTLSVNAHGWAVPFGPFGTTIRSFRLMLADGSVVNCSRTENSELFALVIGGYGLFGIVIDADLDMVENVSLVPKYEVISASAIAEEFPEAARQHLVRMAYARLAISREGFLDSAFLVTYRPVAVQPNPLPAAHRSAAYTVLSRTLFRQQTGSELGKTKVLLHSGPKFLLAADAIFESICEGRCPLVTNSRVTSVTALVPHVSATAICFVSMRKKCRRAI